MMVHHIKLVTCSSSTDVLLARGCSWDTPHSIVIPAGKISAQEHKEHCNLMHIVQLHESITPRAVGGSVNCLSICVQNSITVKNTKFMFPRCDFYLHGLTSLMITFGIAVKFLIVILNCPTSVNNTDMGSCLGLINPFSYRPSSWQNGWVIPRFPPRISCTAFVWTKDLNNLFMEGDRVTNCGCFQ